MIFQIFSFKIPDKIKVFVKFIYKYNFKISLFIMRELYTLTQNILIYFKSKNFIFFINIFLKQIFMY